MKCMKSNLEEPKSGIMKERLWPIPGHFSM